MEFAIECLEIAMNRWKGIYRENEAYMYESPSEYFSKAMDVAQKRIDDISKGLEILKTKTDPTSGF